MAAYENCLSRELGAARNPRSGSPRSVCFCRVYGRDARFQDAALPSRPIESRSVSDQRRSARPFISIGSGNRKCATKLNVEHPATKGIVAYSRFSMRHRRTRGADDESAGVARAGFIVVGSEGNPALGTRCHPDAVETRSGARSVCRVQRVRNEAERRASRYEGDCRLFKISRVVGKCRARRRTAVRNLSAERCDQRGAPRSHCKRG
jgi:hypothetical protein